MEFWYGSDKFITNQNPVSVKRMTYTIFSYFTIKIELSIKLLPARLSSSSWDFIYYTVLHLLS